MTVGGSNIWSDIRVIEGMRYHVLTDRGRAVHLFIKALAYTFVSVLILMSIQKAQAMSILDAGKVCVFSQIEGRLTRDGEALHNTTVIRRWEWNSMKEDSTITDENGYFEFPSVYERSISRFMPVELVIGQGLYVVESGGETQIWSNSKREPEENAELDGRPLKLVCEMTNEMALHEEFSSLLLTLCVWGER